MVALVDDHVAVARDDVVHAPLADEALEHRDVQPTRRLALACTDLADRFRIEAEEHPELGHPLVEQRLPMDQDEGAPPACRHEVGPDHRLADARWRDEDAGVVCQEGPGGLLLDGGQLALEPEVERLACLTPILDGQAAARAAEERSRDHPDSPEAGRRARRAPRRTR